MKRRISCWIVPFILLLTSICFAQGSSSQRQANEHFRRAVDLYGEADFRGALVEFKRAYELAPNNTVLYNIGQSYYQLTDYARALATFEKYLAGDPVTHRTEVEQTVATLKTRVGKLDISCSSGWEVVIDDESAGKCPFSEPVRSGVGRHRVVAQQPGKEPISKNVEVVAGETAPVVLKPESETPKAGGGAAAVKKTETHQASTSEGDSRGTWVTIGWITTGVLAAGAIAVGANALVEQNRLEESRKEYPGDKSEIHTHARRTGQYALIADILGGAAVVTGGITLYFTLSGGKSETQVGVGPGNVRLSGRF